jgi:CRISPR-associated protein Cas2
MVYDAAPKRGTKLLRFLRQHLIWVQNSVFEGEVTESGFEKIIGGVNEIINKKEDCIVYYAFDSMNYIERKVIGEKKNDIDSFI